METQEDHRISIETQHRHTDYLNKFNLPNGLFLWDVYNMNIDRDNKIYFISRFFQKVDIQMVFFKNRILSKKIHTYSTYNKNELFLSNIMDTSIIIGTSQYYDTGMLIKDHKSENVDISIQNGILYVDNNPIELNQVFITTNQSIQNSIYHMEFQRMDILKKEKMLLFYKNYDNSEDLVNLENKIIKINNSLKIEWNNLKKETIESFNEYKELKLISEIEFISNDKTKPTIKIYPPKFPFAYNLKDSPLSVTKNFKLSKQSQLLNQFSEKNIKIFFRLLNELITLKTLIEYNIIEDIQQFVIMADILGFLFFKNYFKEITESLEYKKLYLHV